MGTHNHQGVALQLVHLYDFYMCRSVFETTFHEIFQRVAGSARQLLTPLAPKAALELRDAMAREQQRLTADVLDLPLTSCRFQINIKRKY